MKKFYILFLLLKNIFLPNLETFMPYYAISKCILRFDILVIIFFMFYFELMINCQNLIICQCPWLLHRSCPPGGNNNCSYEVHNPSAKKNMDRCSRGALKLSPRNHGKCENTIIPSYAATTSSYLRKLKDKTMSHRSKFSDIMKSCPKRPQFRPLKKSQKNDRLGTIEKTPSSTCPPEPPICQNLRVGRKRSWN